MDTQEALDPVRLRHTHTHIRKHLKTRFLAKTTSCRLFTETRACYVCFCCVCVCVCVRARVCVRAAVGRGGARGRAERVLHGGVGALLPPARPVRDPLSWIPLLLAACEEKEKETEERARHQR